MVVVVGGIALTRGDGGSGAAPPASGDGIGSADPGSGGVESSPVGLPRIRLTGPEVTLGSASDFEGTGAATVHQLEVQTPPPGGGTLEVTVVGPYGAADRTAAAMIEGALVGTLGDSSEDCLTLTSTFPLAAEELIWLADDGLVEVSVENSPDVGTTCGVNRHTVELRYDVAVDQVDFDEVFVGTTRGFGIVVHNDGTEILEVQSISTDSGDFSSDETYLLVSPGESSPLEVRFTPTTVGAFQAILQLATNDPTQAIVEVPLTAIALAPPVVGTVPGELSATLAAGKGETQTLTVLNTGGSDLEFTVELGPPSGGGLAAGSCAPARAYVVESATGDVSTIDLVTGFRSPVGSGISDPQGIAVNHAGTQAYVTRPAAGELVRIDLVTGVVATVASGLGEPAGLDLRDDGQLAYVVQADRGELSAVDLMSGQVTLIASGLGGPSGVAVDRSGTTALVTDPASGRLLSVELATGTVREIVSGLDAPTGVSWSAVGGAIVTAQQAGELLSIDVEDGSVTTLASGLASPAALSLDVGGEVAYVLESGENRLAAVDLTTGLIVDVAAVDGGPLGMVLGIPTGCAGSFLSVSPGSGSVPPSGSLDLSVRFEAAGLGAETFAADLALRSNDPATPRLAVQATLAVAGGPAISLVDIETLESVLFYAAIAAVTPHPFPVSDTAGKTAVVEIEALGDFGEFNELATVTIDGSLLGTVGNTGLGMGSCGTPATGSFPVPDAVFQAAAADGIVEVVVANNIAVDPFLCLVNIHTVRLLISSSSTSRDFGTVFVGEATAVTFVVSNVGTETLEVSSIASDIPEFQPSVTSASLPPGASQDVLVTFLTASPGSFAANLTFASNDPVTPVLSLPLTAVAVGPPVITVTPPSLSEDLLTGQISTQLLTIANDGASDLPWELTVQLAPGGTEVAPDFLSASPESGTVPAGSSQDVTVTFDATGLPTSNLDAEIVIDSNDPVTPQVIVPATLGVTGAPDIIVGGEEIVLESVVDYFLSGDLTTHSFPITFTPGGDGFLEVSADGDFGSSLETATVTAEGTILGSLGGVGADCEVASEVFSLDVALLTALTSDGSVDVGVQNSLFVDVFCNPNRHTVRLSYPALEGALDFGTLFTGQSRSLAATIGNLGTDALVVSSIASGLPEFGLSVSILTIPAGGSEVLTVTFEPTVAGTFEGTLSIVSDDPDTPLVTISLSGIALDPPVIGVAPASLSESLLSGQTSAQVLTLLNTGGSDLDWALLPLDAATLVFLDVTPSAGTVPAGGSQDLAVTFDATTLNGGLFDGVIGIASNDPATPELLVPAQLGVTGIPDLVIEGEAVVVESAIDYSVDGAFTLHSLPVSVPPSASGTIELIADGDFGQTSETATATVEGTVLGSVGGTGADCIPASGTFALEAALLTALASDGTVAVEVQNTTAVGVFCLTNRHTVRLSYAGSKALEFGTVFAGASPVRSIVIRNLGTDVLEVASISSDLPEFVPSATSFLIPAGGSELLAVVFSSNVVGSFDGTLSIASNDPDTPLVTVPLSAVAAEPPIVGVSPASLTESLFTGEASTRLLTLSNSGGSDLEFAVRIAGRQAPGGSCVPGVAYVAGSSTDNVFAVDLATGAVTVVASELRTPVDLVLSPAGDVLYVTEFVVGQLSTIDLVTGVVTMVSAGLSAPAGVDVDASGSIAYVVEYLDGRLSAVDLATGTITTLVSGLQAPLFVRLTSDEALAYVTEFGTSSLLAVEIATGTVSVVTTDLQGPAGLSLDEKANLAFIAEFSGGALPSVDLTTGEVRREATGFAYPTGVALDSSRPRAYVATSPALGQLARIDLLTGIQTVVGAVGVEPYGIELDCSGALLSAHPETGSIPPGGSLDLSVLFDATGVQGGTYEADIQIDSNDPINPSVTIPTTLVVTGVPDIEVTGVEVSLLESGIDFFTDGARTQHALDVELPPGGDGIIELIADGDFGFGREVATVTVEGTVVGSTGPTGVDCTPAVGAFVVSADDFSLLAADGVIEVEVQNDPQVGAFCAVNRHTVRIRYSGPRDQEFGGVFVGLIREATFLVQNRGTDVLEVTSITADLPEFSVSPAAFSLAPRGSLAVTVAFAPSALAVFEGTLSIFSNDPEEGEVQVSVRGEGLDPTAPIAVLAAPAETECTGPDGVLITLDGTGSTDPDSTPGTNDDIVLFEWFEDLGLPSEALLGTGPTLPVTLPVGGHSVSLVVTDTRGTTDTATAIVTTIDTGAPTLTVVPDRASLWPPNHGLVPVAVAIQADDLCDPSPLVVLVSASSSEEDNAIGTGDGDTDGDIVGADLGTRDAAIELRAERDGSGAGRTYELHYAATDASANTVPAVAVVNVPHDQGEGPDPILMQLEPTGPASGVHLLWPAVPDASSYDVVAGTLSALQVVDQVLLLGDVTVLAAANPATASTDAGTTPPPGEVIFYLIQYRTEQGGTGYGTESALWPREPTSCTGGCP